METQQCTHMRQPESPAACCSSGVAGSAIVFVHVVGLGFGCWGLLRVVYLLLGVKGRGLGYAYVFIQIP